MCVICGRGSVGQIRSAPMPKRGSIARCEAWRISRRLSPFASPLSTSASRRTTPARQNRRRALPNSFAGQSGSMRLVRDGSRLHPARNCGWGWRMRHRVLITGGAGFVGSHLADALLDRGCTVRVFDNLSSQVHPQGRPPYLSGEVELVRGDMLDIESLRGAVRGVDVIFHFAAAVGVGQSMYEIAHYMGVNTQ